MQFLSYLCVKSYKIRPIYLLSPSVKVKIDKEIQPLKKVENGLNSEQQIQRHSRDRNVLSKTEGELLRIDTHFSGS